MAYKDGLKYLTRILNFLFLCIIAITFAKLNFVPFGFNHRRIIEIFKVFDNEQRSSNYILSKNSIKNFKDYKSSVYPLMREQINKKLKDENIIILIIAESLGAVKNKKLNEKLQLLYEKELSRAIRESNKKNYFLKKLPNEDVPGGTLRMEYLTLCNSFKDQYEDIFKDCIPKLLQNKRDWSSSYLHSASLNFYNRKSIMNDIGFDQLYSSRDNLIKEKFLLKQIKLCITRYFCAPSDAELFEIGLKKIKNKKSNNYLLNILTLEAHGPYRTNNLLGKRLNNNEKFLEKAKLSLEQISYFIKNVLIDIKTPNINIFIVSDHPPILNTGNTKFDFNYSFQITSKK